MTKEQAAATVHRYVDGIRYGQDIDLIVDDQHIVVGDKWVRVPLRPSYYPQRLMPFYLFLADLNEEIVAKENFNYVLTTGEPLREETEDAEDTSALTSVS